MSIKNWLQLIILLALTTVYAVWFTDWFKPKVIRIGETSRPAAVYRVRARASTIPTAAIPPYFILGATYKLTEVKVVRLSAWQTNHEVLPVWHLITTSNALPVLRFHYGLPRDLPAMQPALPGTRAEPLVPDETYRIFVKAGAYKGQMDFTAKPAD